MDHFIINIKEENIDPANHSGVSVRNENALEEYVTGDDFCSTPIIKQEEEIKIECTAEVIMENLMTENETDGEVSIELSANDKMCDDRYVPEVHTNCDTIGERHTQMETGYLKSEIAAIKKHVQNIAQKQEQIINRQDDLAKMLGETNALLRENLGLSNDSMTKRFPLKCEEDLQILEDELLGGRQFEIVLAMRKQLAGSTSNINKILNQDLIMSHNYDGMKGKKSLKTYGKFINALFEATSRENRTYEEFLNEIRNALRLLKNRCHKQDSRKRKSVTN